MSGPPLPGVDAFGPPGPSGSDPGAQAVIARLSANKVATMLPFIIGTYIDTVLLGLVLVALVYWWRKVRPTDPGWIRALVSSQVVLTCIQTGVLLSRWFVIFAEGFGDLRTLRDASSMCTLLSRLDFREDDSLMRSYALCLAYPCLAVDLYRRLLPRAGVQSHR